MHDPLEMTLGNPDAPTKKKLALLFSAYLCQNVPLGFLTAALPVILRSQGFSIKMASSAYALYLPWAFKWLYAKYIDDHYSERMGRRRSWIVPLQFLGAGLVALAAFTPPDSAFGIMFALFALFSLSASTSDIAVDGYATDILTPAERPWGNATQCGGRFLGLLTGGGGFLALYAVWGWPQTLLLLAVVTAILALPTAFSKEIASKESPITQPDGEREGLFAFLRRKETRWTLALVVLAMPISAPLQLLYGTFLTDMGFSKNEIGTMLICVGYPAGFLGVMLGARLFGLLGAARCLGGGLLAAGILCAMAAGQRTLSPATAWTLVGASNALAGLTGVILHTVMMRSSVGPHSGMNFSVMMGAFFFAPLLAVGVFAWLGDRFGYGVLFGCAAFTGIFGCVATTWIFAKHLAERDESLPLADGTDPAMAAH